MRTHQQRKILELLKTLEEAQSAGLYAACQEGAVSVGGFIESIEGEGTKTVALLEEYCEQLYKASMGETEEKLLSKSLIKIENSVRSELKPHKIEVVFLSYNASMSDALESVYLAAKADPNCDAYWIPVPYYERRTDGSFSEMRYEGTDYYGDNITCTDWREYDIGARHPDVIFTFAPYDGGNFVTSVHPDYYCERLRSLTDLLIYIPYFVVTDDVSEQFCTVAGCIYAHKVIVQSETIRDTYIRVFEENFGNRFGKPKDKFIALGSPKFDKVINASKADFILPDEWRERINNRKVIFYNTSVGSLLQDSGQYLKKLRHVLDIFRERNDVVLWWRPHPLSSATYQSMRPQFAGEYDRIVAKYRTEGFGIYDDTPDLHRAIVWSDAYYGDRSSLVSICEMTGKPVMEQNINVGPHSEGHNSLPFENLYDDGDCFWFTAWQFNALFKMNKSTWQAKYMGSFPGEQFDKRRLYGQIAACNGKLYFAPFSADKIAVYDIETGAYGEIEFSDPKLENKKKHTVNCKFYSALAYKNNVFFVGYDYPAIIKYDTLSGKIEYFSEWVDSIDKKAKSVSGYFLNVCISGNCIVAPATNANAVLVFDLDTCVSSVYEVGSKQNSYAGVCCGGDDHYLLAPKHEGNVVIWNRGTNEWKEYGDYPKGFEKRMTSFRNVVYSNGYAWLFPLRANMALKINMKTKAITVAEEFQAYCLEEKSLFGLNFSLAKSFDDLIYVFAGKADYLVEYNSKTGQRREEKIFLTDEESLKMNEEYPHMFNKDISACLTIHDCNYYESINFRLQGFINYVSQNSRGKSDLSDKKFELSKKSIPNFGCCGAKIYEYSRSAVK